MFGIDVSSIPFLVIAAIFFGLWAIYHRRGSRRPTVKK